VVFSNTFLKKLHEGLKGARCIRLHDVFAVHLTFFFVFFIEGKKSIAESKDASSGLRLHLHRRLRNHQITENRHQLSVVFNLNVRAELVH